MESLKTCPSSKRRFKNEVEAQRAARDGMLLRGVPQLDTYFCTTCYGYHLTSSLRKTKKKKSAK